MIVSELRLCDFRNLPLVHLEPNPRFNIFEGRNGQGKTNILESIYVLGALKSFRASAQREMIRFDATHAEVRGVLNHENSERVIRLRFSERGRQIWLDGSISRTLADALGRLTVVLFAPEDLAITKGSPSGRRRFIDRAVFNRWPASLADMKRYTNALQQRNALLKRGGADDMLDVFDQQVAEAGASVLRWRQKYLEEFTPLLIDSLNEVSEGELQVTLSYESEMATTALSDRIEGYIQDRHRDRRRGSTNRGPHVDDLQFLINGRSARSFASQGQHRALVLAMKIAEIRLLQNNLGYSPVLLLDDVSSELDARRNELLMTYLTSDAFQGQVFLTTTDRSYVRIDSNFSCFTICAGEIQ